MIITVKKNNTEKKSKIKIAETWNLVNEKTSNSKK